MTEPTLVLPTAVSQTFRRKVSQSRIVGLAGAAILLAIGIAAAFAPLLAPYGAEVANPEQILVPPGAQHWLGTDTNGMDILSRIMWGGRVDLFIALLVALASFGVGSLIGGAAGYSSIQGRSFRVSSSAMLRVLEVLQAFPAFVLALALVGVAGRSVSALIFVLIVVQAPVFIRISRSAVLAVCKQSYIESARCAGGSETAIFFRHILPNSLTASIAMISPVAGGSLLMTAGLSFLGAGVPAPTPEWGYMVSVGASDLYTGQWWPALIPGIMIGVTILGFALVGRSTEHFRNPLKR